MRREITYLRLDEVRPAPRNPKRHAEDAIRRSISHHGLAEVPLLDGRTGRLVAGHGRWEQLQAMRTAGDSPPDGITVADDGEWLMPVITGWESRSDADAEAYVVGSNRLTVLGGWDDHQLADVLEDLQAEGLADLAGYADDDITEVTRAALTDDNDGNPFDYGGPGEGERENPYAMATNIPQYEIVGDRPEINEMYDETKTTQLRDRVLAADLPEDLRDYLLAAAARHTVFKYSKAAEYYAHAPADVQELMEDSALVIIDVEDGIRNGYVKLTSSLAAALEKDKELYARGSA